MKPIIPNHDRFPRANIDQTFITANSACRLRIYRRPSCTVVMFSELPGSERMSVTNAAEELIEAAINHYQLPITSTIFVEHYPNAYHQRMVKWKTHAESLDTIHAYVPGMEQDAFWLHLRRIHPDGTIQYPKVANPYENELTFLTECWR